MNIESAKEFIESAHSSSSVKWIDKGQMNYIAVVDEKFVYKFPKKPENFSLLKKEYEIYRLLDSQVTLDIPKPLELNVEQQYLKLSFVSGATLSVEQASSLAHAQQQDLASKIAVFIKELNSPSLRQGFDVIFSTDTNDFYYIDDWLENVADYCKSHDSELAKKYLGIHKEFRDKLPYGFCVGDVIAHKDLHEDNMLFGPDMELTGIIDFAEVRYTSIYSELRTVVRFGEDVVESIIEQLGSLATGVKSSDVLLFARVYEMAIIVQNKYIQKELDWRVAQAEYYLNQWGVI